MSFKRTPHRCVSILVADDFSQWRAEVRSILQARPEWKVVCEAINGIEAVEKASELHPDIILLDVGMPHLNGIEAAKIIHQRCPISRILFVTQNSDDDIRHAAMQAGAVGYVVKANVRNELLNAITTALRD